LLAEDVLRVEARRRVESRQGLGGVLFEVLLGEDVFDFVVEANVVDHEFVTWYLIPGLKGVEFVVGQLNFLDAKDVTELLVGNITLSQEVVVLEEFEKADSVFLALVLDLEHEGVVTGVITGEVSPFFDIGRFKLGGRSKDGIFEAVSGLEEFIVLDLVFLGAVDGLDEGDVLFG
jgi:hypothetical protein